MAGTDLPWSAGKAYLAMVGLSLVVVVVLAAIGYVPAGRYAEQFGPRSMLVGLLVSWIASCLGAIPLARTGTASGSGRATAALMSMGVRFFVVLLLVVPLMLSGWFDRLAFVLSVGVSYLVLLVLDTLFAVRMIQRTNLK